jgi:hypothetical protein
VHLLGGGKAVEFAKQPRSVTSGPFGEMGDEGLDQIPTGLAELLSAAEISGVAFNTDGVELILSD